MSYTHLFTYSQPLYIYIYIYRLLFFLFFIFLNGYFLAGCSKGNSSNPSLPTDPPPKKTIQFELHSSSPSPGQSKSPHFTLSQLPAQELGVSVYLGDSTSTCTSSNLVELGSSRTVEASQTEITIGDLGEVLDSDGTYKFFIRVSGTDFSECDDLTYVLDTSPPSIVSPSTNQPLENDQTPMRSRTWTWGCLDETQCQYRYTLGSTPLSGTSCSHFDLTGIDYSDLASATKESAPNVNGKYCLSIQARDQAGNESSVVSVYGVFDNEPPVVPTVTLPGQTYAGGDYLDITLSFQEDIVVTGTPRIPLTINNLPRHANYYRGSGSPDLVFRYQVVQADGSHDGIGGVDSLELNTGSVTDVAGNSITSATSISLTAPSNLSSVLIRGDRGNLILSETDLSVGENGQTGTYTLKLNNAPSNNVVVTLSRDSGQWVSVHPETITFEPNNDNGKIWSAPQTVTVTGINDNVDNDFGGNPARVTEIEHDISSTSPGYINLSSKVLRVTSVDDDDVGGVQLSLNPQSFSEHDPNSGNTLANHTKSVQVTAQFVNSQVSLGSQLVLDISVAPQTAQAGDFTAVGNFNLTIPQGSFSGTGSFSLTLIDDAVDEGDERIQVSGSVSGLTGVSIQPVDFTIEDNDERGLTLSSQSVTVSKYGRQGEYTVRLNTEPTGPVRVRLTSSNGGVATVSPDALTFEPDNTNGKLWSVPQTVTVTGVSDNQSGNTTRQASISHIVSGGGYQGLTSPSLAVTVNSVRKSLAITVHPDIDADNDDSYSVSGTCYDITSVSVTIGSMSAQTATCDSGTWELTGVDTSSDITSNGDIEIVAEADSDGLRATVSVNRCVSSGTGDSSSDPLLICQYGDLKELTKDENRRKHFALDKDIDASASWEEGGQDCNAYSPANGVAPSDPCTGWDQNIAYFHGSLDGQGHTVSNLYIYNTEDNDVGLFKAVWGTVKNLHLHDVYIQSANTKGRFTGGLAANTFRGTIDNCSVTGKIVSKATYLGGLVGQLSGNIFNSYTDLSIIAEIRNAYTPNRLIGGLNGYIVSNSNSVLTSSYSRGTITVDSGGVGSRNVYIGGLSGDCSTINTTYSKVSEISIRGTKTENENFIVGGLVGNIECSGTFGHSYFAGTAKGSHMDPIGNLTSLNGNSNPSLNLTNIFWDKSLSNETSGISSGVTGLTSTEMKDSCANDSTTGICALGDGFSFSNGQYPKVKKCTTCSGTLVFSDELVGGQ